MLDSSTSICGQQGGGGGGAASCYNWALLLGFVQDMADAFRVGEFETRVGVVTFSTDATLEIPLNAHYGTSGVRDALRRLQYVGGQTNTGKALFLTRTQCFSERNGERSGVPNIAVVITDGLPTILDFNLNAQARMLQDVATVLAVGVTRDVESELLRQISSPPQRENENFFSTPDFSGLDTILRALVVETCRAPLKTTPAPVVSGNAPCRNNRATSDPLLSFCVGLVFWRCVFVSFSTGGVEVAIKCL